MATKIPAFSYTGSYTTQMIDDYWVIFLTGSGTLRMNYSHDIDVYVLGGGGGGGGSNASEGGGGGGGYQTVKLGVSAQAGTDYAVEIGAGGAGGRYSSGWDGTAGGTSSAFGATAAGGGGGELGDSNDTWAKGGAGGTGNGANRDGDPGSNTVRAFEESSESWPLYGGGGASHWNDAGGLPYGGAGDGSHATGYGGGGGGGAEDEYATEKRGGGNGYQGIVIIRGLRDDELPVKFDGVTLNDMFFNGSAVKHLIHNGAQIFMERARRWWSEWLRQGTLSLRPVR